MTTHELMIKTNHHLIKDGELTDAQKANIIRHLLDAQNDERTKQNFYKGVKYPGKYILNGTLTKSYLPKEHIGKPSKWVTFYTLLAEKGKGAII